jgi:hypothetical protein
MCFTGHASLGKGKQQACCLCAVPGLLMLQASDKGRQLFLSAALIMADFERVIKKRRKKPPKQRRLFK